MPDGVNGGRAEVAGAEATPRWDRAPKRSGTTRVPLADKAEQQLRSAILEGALLPGAPLVEADLVQQLGMSKTPVREALRLLAHSGLITTDAFRTWRVRVLSSEDVQNIFDIRAILESTAIGRACTRSTQEGRRHVRETMRSIEEVAQHTRHPTLAQANRRLHGALIAECGNQEIIDVVASYGDRLTLAVVQGWQRYDTSIKELDEHREIVEAYLDGDADRASTLMREHIEGFACVYRSEADGGR
ncbi:GntR family transcriptional regulator [Pseudonocardia sp. C8]|uniref:GntR family transcriptional regulator n=1 Tax=Pseudonocardia sp. C8 TaxID=2762759 RepID=UPI001642D174|nr:GntR family transcriptional regulator [Pseudonocardia sp. C8]MBC3191075.1 GntR family transcriptional regulator [Pseudonocardia sp. C8]